MGREESRPILLERETKIERSSAVLFTWYYVHGPKGTVQFMLMTWPAVNMVEPMDLGVHSYDMIDDNQEPMPCKLLAGGACYYQGSALAGQRLYAEYLENPEPDRIWQLLEEYYERTFGL